MPPFEPCGDCGSESYKAAHICYVRLVRFLVISGFMVWLYGFRYFRPVVLRVARRSEGGEFYSRTLRRIFREHWGVEIGMYSHGGCFEPWAVDRHTRIGRYCSIARDVRIMNANHPLDFKGTSGLFFNPKLGYCSERLVQSNPLEIGSDVWIGARAIILPEVNRIGHGAVIGAGSVVNRDVPDYAVVLGNPGRVVKYRFPRHVIDALLEEAWWERDLDDLALRIDEYTRPFASETDLATALVDERERLPSRQP